MCSVNVCLDELDFCLVLGEIKGSIINIRDEICFIKSKYLLKKENILIIWSQAGTSGLKKILNVMVLLQCFCTLAGFL